MHQLKEEQILHASAEGTEYPSIYPLKEEHILSYIYQRKSLSLHVLANGVA